MKILIVDDETVSLTKLQMLMSAYGECDFASSGEQALELFKKAHADANPYGIVTMDIQMPGMSGQAAVTILRDWEKANALAPTRVVMVTVSSDIKAVSSSMKSGADAFLTKPFNQDSVREVMNRLREKSKQEAKAKNLPPST